MTSPTLKAQIRSDLYTLIDQYRSQCLWYLRPDYYPENEEQAMRVLKAIAQHGDRNAYIKTKEIREWLLRDTNVQSVV